MFASGDFFEAPFERLDHALVGASVGQLRERLLRQILDREVGMYRETQNWALSCARSLNSAKIGISM
ncbi:hypothetical protein [Bradyrhizobium erythrophlei]|uniref:hypothetical protein n=1 Tax=Bradyrhizobium erythrophlei TaxID=1437360 RepID=UPI00115FC557|nr:hypothetical protein [Bradyrhizobium erythrophlei]